MASTRSAAQKLKSRAVLARLVRRAAARGRRVVFTNGCFDLLHPGHIQLLERAKSYGDLLIVGLNSDRSTRAIKGAPRPIMTQRDRARLVGALESVDYVTIFNEQTPLRLVEALRPHVLIKGADWGAAKIVGRDLVRGRGGRVIRFPLVKGHSTSKLIARIRSASPRLSDSVASRHRFPASGTAGKRRAVRKRRR